ncbi:hypothetical protein PHAMO_210355 [Magnetospirillum molischianum DSM 120]|uniref:Uncharacterized protein n=1 Tax=Magnetospirillum molischianum DSM 120 TaxID=1150626 RepID=H8FR56_MAGML|nr:hypothetical protein PHAMO_210355 [Magnetospirillum molischianum DSM 120]
MWSRIARLAQKISNTKISHKLNKDI